MSALFIILTAEEAEAVRGPTAPGAALEPVTLVDSERFALPEAVLADPDHARHHVLLEALARRVLAVDEVRAAPPLQ